MTPSRFNAAILILATVLSSGCATTLYDTLLEGADRIIAIHTAKDKPRLQGSNPGESVRVTSSMKETSVGAAPSATANGDEKAYRTRSSGVDVRQRASVAKSGRAQDGVLQDNPWALIRVERANRSLPANAPAGYGTQYAAARAAGSAQDVQEANSREAIDAMESLMMAKSQGETSNVSASRAYAPAAGSAAVLPSDVSMCAQLERDLWAAYKAFDFERVEQIAPRMAGLSSATARQAATAWFLAGAAAYLRGDAECARALFRQAALTDKLFAPDTSVFPDHMLEFFKKSTETADS